MAVALKAIEAQVRPHFSVDCWCGPTTCECCGGVGHRIVDIAPDVQPRMAVFSDQRASGIAF